MKRMLTVVVVSLLLAVSFGLAHAAGPHLKLDHKLTGFTKGEAGAIADYSLHVVNQGATPITELTLSLMPHPPLLGKRVTVSVGTLAPHQETNVPLQVVVPVLPDGERLSEARLFWAGKCVDATGKTVEFAVMSKSGGAR